MPSIKKKEWYPWVVNHITGKPMGKAPETFTFEAHFKALGQAKVDELQGKALKRQIDDDTFLGEILVGWSGVQDAEGADLAYSPDALKLLRETYPGIMASVGYAWTDSVQGGILRKN